LALRCREKGKIADMKKFVIGAITAIAVLASIYLTGASLRDIVEAPVRVLDRLILFALVPFVVVAIGMAVIRAMKALGLSRVLCGIGVHSWKDMIHRDVCEVCGKRHAI
jgi:hypothetical protein